MVKTATLGIFCLWWDRFETADRFRSIKLNFVMVEVNEVFGRTKICNFDVEFMINQNIFCFDIAMGNSIRVKFL